MSSLFALTKIPELCGFLSFFRTISESSINTNGNPFQGAEVVIIIMIIPFLSPDDLKDVDSRPWDFQAEECALRAAVDRFNHRRYDKGGGGGNNSSGGGPGVSAAALGGGNGTQSDRNKDVSVRTVLIHC